MQFRNDINGLRAIAVIAVVLFHFNESWMPGGFAGVDVFFVISGFLMTRIIFRGIEQENFSVLKFYVARANRIIPALAVLCFFLLTFSYFWLSNYNFSVLNKHIFSSITFISNIVYLTETGYFDVLSREKWLLHTWSLSVEWQFYIIYPVVLVAMGKIMSIKTMKMTVLFGTILGFVFCVIATYRWPSFSYYLLPTRAWEMLIGGVAYLSPFVLGNKRKKLVEWLGLALILGTYFFISKETPWPGYLAIFPVLGAFLIIQSQRNDSIITSNVVFQKIGAWSYSIYLWHWPIVVAIYYFSLSAIFVYLGIIISIFIGWLSFEFVERTKVNKFKLVMFLFVLFISLYVVIERNISFVLIKSKPNYVKSDYCSDLERFCKAHGDLNKLDFILWGDSFAHKLSDVFALKGYNFISFSTDGCPPIKGVRRADLIGNSSNCNNKTNDKIFDRINTINNVNKLLLIGRWSLYNHGLEIDGILQKETTFLCFDDCVNISSKKSLNTWKLGFLKTVKTLNNKFDLVVFKGGPILKVRGADYRESDNLYLMEHLKYEEQTDAYIDSQALEHGFITIDYGKYFFENKTLVVEDNNNNLLFIDRSHATVSGWNYIFKNFEVKLNEALTQ